MPSVALRPFLHEVVILSNRSHLLSNVTVIPASRGAPGEPGTSIGVGQELNGEMLQPGNLAMLACEL